MAAAGVAAVGHLGVGAVAAAGVAEVGHLGVVATAGVAGAGTDADPRVRAVPAAASASIHFAFQRISWADRGRLASDPTSMSCLPASVITPSPSSKEDCL